MLALSYTIINSVFTDNTVFVSSDWLCLTMVMVVLCGCLAQFRCMRKASLLMCRI